MDNDPIAGLVRFFADVDIASVLFPDGWRGRPCDNRYRLIRARFEDGLLLIDLEENTFLRIHPSGEMKRRGRAFEIPCVDGELLREDPTAGQTASRVQSFESGFLTLVSPKGYPSPEYDGQSPDPAGVSELLGRQLLWQRTGNARLPYWATIDRHALTIRLGDFPEEAMYALLVDGVFVAEFDDWPILWGR